MYELWENKRSTVKRVRDTGMYVPRELIISFKFVAAGPRRQGFLQSLALLLSSIGQQNGRRSSCRVQRRGRGSFARQGRSGRRIAAQECARSSAYRLLYNCESDSHLVPLTLVWHACLVSFLLLSSQALNSDGQPWKLDFERPELRLRVFYSSVPGEKLYKFKATCELPGMRMEDMWAMLEDNVHRLTWDRNISDITHTRHVPLRAGSLLRISTNRFSEISHYFVNFVR